MFTEPLTEWDLLNPTIECPNVNIKSSLPQEILARTIEGNYGLILQSTLLNDSRLLQTESDTEKDAVQKNGN
jgi:hypothetical protein